MSCARHAACTIAPISAGLTCAGSLAAMRSPTMWPRLRPTLPTSMLCVSRVRMHMVVFRHRVHLGLAPQAAEGAGEHDPVVILVKIGATQFVDRRVRVAQPVGRQQLLPVHCGALQAGMLRPIAPETALAGKLQIKCK